MPRGKKKAQPMHDSRPCSDDEDTADNRSTVSALSDDICSVTDDGADVSDVDDAASQDNTEDKLNECFDLVSIKSAKGRQECLIEIQKAFRKKYLHDFLNNRKETAAAALLFCLKKGKGEEVTLATKCASLLCLQMGESMGQAFTQMRPVMLTLMNDKSSDLNSRGQCALSLAICSLVSTNEIDQITSLMTSLENVFHGSYKKGDGSAPNLTPDVGEFHTICLSAWSLLLSVTPAYIAQKIICRCLPRLPEILHSPHVDLRIIAGDTIALMYELARESDEEFEHNDFELLKTLKVLATDCYKYRAKKDRRQQRSSFRDILRYIELNEITMVDVKFGREHIRIDSWVYRCQYNILSATLGTGMNLHLQENVLVRDIFGLGPPLPITKVGRQKSSKLERTLHNAAMFKARTKTRNKQRDKRSFAANNGF